MAGRTADHSLVRAYYAPWDPESERYCLAMRDTLAEAQFEVLDIVSNQASWTRTGMRTVPAFEVVRDGRPARMLSGRVRAASLRAALGSGGGPAARPEQHAMTRIEPLEVVAGTGSYRYDRWGEQFLADYRRADCGWSSPTRTGDVFEQIVFDTLRTHIIRQIGMTPRPWLDETRFPRAFDIEVSQDRSTWVHGLKVTSFECHEPTTHYWPLAQTARYLRLTVRDVARSSGERHVVQIMKFEVWGQPLDAQASHHLAVGSWQPTARGPAAAQACKVGLFSADEPTATSAWHLPPGAHLPPRHCLQGRGKLLVAAGTVIAHEHESGEQATLSPGDWAAYLPGMTLSVSNPSDQSPATVLEVRVLAPAGEVWSATG